MSWRNILFLHNPCHIFRQRCGETHMLPCDRVNEFHVVGVQSLTCHVLHVWVVQVVTNQWITEIFHMNTDLVGAASLKTKWDKAVPICFFYHFIMRGCFFSMFPVYGALNDGSFLTSKWSTDGSFWRLTPRTIARYSRWTSRYFVISERILPLTRCLDTIVSPEVSRSRRLQHRKMKGFPWDWK